MNLYELDRLIKSLDREKDQDLIEFYLKKRAELIAKIAENVMTQL